MKYVILAVLAIAGWAVFLYRKFIKADVSSVEADAKLALADVKREALAYKIKLAGFANRLEDAAKKDEASVAAEAKKVVSEIRGLF